MDTTATHNFVILSIDNIERFAKYRPHSLTHTDESASSLSEQKQFLHSAKNNHSTPHHSMLHQFQGTIHLVFSSHWDREWYLPFQKFRGRLVGMLDEVFNELESGRLPFYQMDGQFIPVEDYLQMRPKKEALVRRLIAECRFRVGPWYNLPDGFLVSGESLVRNLLLGMKRAEAFGFTSKVGWMCDTFGHNSQMPQIFSQLGIETGIVWRGVKSQTGSPFLWKAADGTEILAHRFTGRHGYCDFSGQVRLFKETPSVSEMVEAATKYLAATCKTSSAKNLLWFDGGDHLEFDPAVLDVVSEINKQAGREMVKVSTLDDYMAALRDESPSGSTVKGELREPAAMDSLNWLIPGVGSSRIPLKQANHACETLLTLWAEPWCAAAAFALGREYPARALEVAWEYLLKNHPHDSICGCSTDEAHAAMPYRFDQSRQIAEFHLDAALKAISAVALTGNVQPEEIGASLFAPVGGTLSRSPELLVRLPKDWPQFNEFFGYEKKPSLRIYNLQNQEIPYQLLQVYPSSNHLRITRLHFPLSEERQGVRLALDTILAPGEVQHYVIRREEGPVRLPQQNAIGVGRHTLRNEFIEATAENDGTLTLCDLKSGRSYHGLLEIEDSADIGDGWFHGVSLQDRAYLSTGGNVTFGITENGPLLARLQIRVEWLVPEAFDFRTNERSRKLVPLVVEHLVTLRKDEQHLQIDTTVHNQVRDHRLRILFPSGLAGADRFWADTPFDAIERSVALREDNHRLRELQVEMTPQQNWVATTDFHHGLAAIAPGQYESAVLDQPDRPLCVTLLRAFRRAVMTDGNDGGQIQGTHHFRMAVKPFAGNVPVTELFQIAQNLAAEHRMVTIETQELKDVVEGSANIKERPQIKGAVVLSSTCLDGEKQWVFRVFNPTSEPATIQLSRGSSWEKTDLRGNNAEKILSQSAVVAPKQILTLHATPSSSPR